VAYSILLSLELIEEHPNIASEAERQDYGSP